MARPQERTSQGTDERKVGSEALVELSQVRGHQCYGSVLLEVSRSELQEVAARLCDLFDEIIALDFVERAFHPDVDFEEVVPGESPELEIGRELLLQLVDDAVVCEPLPE